MGGARWVWTLGLVAGVAVAGDDATVVRPSEPVVTGPYQPYLMSTSPRALAQGSFAIELGGGFDGLAPPELDADDLDPDDLEEALEERARDATDRGTAWWESAVGLGGGVQLETGVRLGDRQGTFGLVEGRAEVRVATIPERLSLPVQLTLGAGWAVDARGFHALTGVLAFAGEAGRVDVTVNARLAHVFEPERDPVDVRVSAGTLVRATPWLRAGVEYAGVELEEKPDDEDAADGGGRHYVGPTVVLSAMKDHLRFSVGGGAVVAGWGVGPAVQGSAAWQF
ncbi:MAG: hypothetical protein H6733_03950 [Alphaproteobacteria bacterium]|nr:hypothetical protein [Alphaproteobacteria bacterium]